MRPAKTSVIHFASQVGISVAGFVATIYFARELGASVYGSFVLVLALLYWFNIPASAIDSSIIKRVSERRDRSAFLSAGALLNLGIGVIAVAVIVVSRSHITAYVGAPVANLLALLVIGKIAFGTSVAGLNGQKLVAIGGGLRLSERLLRIAIQVSLVVLTYGLLGLIIGQVVSLLIASALGLWFYKEGFDRPRLDHFRELLTYARYSWLGTVKSRVLGPSVDVLILQAIIGSTALVGIYQISWNIASILVLIAISIQQTLFPEISELAVDDDYSKIRELLGEGLVFTGIFAIPGFFGALALGDRVLHIYGGDFVRGHGILLILILARTIASFTSQLTSAVNAVDRPDLGFRLNLLFLGANIGLDLVLIPLFSWYGAAGATALAAVIALGANYYVLVDQIGHIEVPIRELLNQLLAAVLMILIVQGMQFIIPWRDDFVTVGLVGIGALVYGTAVLALSPWVRSKTKSLLPSAEIRPLL